MTTTYSHEIALVDIATDAVVGGQY